MIRGSTGLIAHIGFSTRAFKAHLIYTPQFTQANIDVVMAPMGCRAVHYPDFLRAEFTLDNIRGALITMPKKCSSPDAGTPQSQQHRPETIARCSDR